MNAKYSEAIFKLGWLVTSQPKLTFFDNTPDDETTVLPNL